jgi:hypothetical protein
MNDQTSVFEEKRELCESKRLIPAIDLIVMRQNRTADETLIQIGKGIPR